MRLKQGIISFISRLAGSAVIMEKQQKVLLVLGNALKYSLTDPDKLKKTTIYKRCCEMISLLSPMDITGEQYVRVGQRYDGGYVMVDEFNEKKVRAAYSLGIGDNVSWDEALANMGIDVFMYDHTIRRLPKRHSKFHYFKIGVTGNKKGSRLKTLEELIVKNGHASCKDLIMKMDVEGCEWDIFREVKASVINQFSQIIVEFHDLASSLYDSRCLSMMDVFRKINQTHQSVHVHANSLGIPLWVGDMVLPADLEVTYVRRTDFNDAFVANTRQFPTEIDMSTNATMPDVYLGDFLEKTSSHGKA